MKSKLISCFAAFVLIVSTVIFSIFAPPVQSGGNNDNSSNIISILEGETNDLCKELYSLLSLPENRGYLISDEKLKSMTINERIQEWQTGRQLLIPKTQPFENFKEPVWETITEEEAYRFAPDFIEALKRGDKRNISAELGNDYKMQKAKIDMNMDGNPETVYRSMGRVTMDFFSVHFSRHDIPSGTTGLNLIGQIVLYKDMPVFLVRELGVYELIATPSIGNWNIFRTVKPENSFVSTGCRLSSIVSNYSGDKK